MRIAIAGVGVAGGVVATGLTELPGVEVLAFERVGPDDHAVAGNGLNVGPNALIALDQVMPDMAARLRAVSLRWRQWQASTMAGERLLQLPLAEVAASDGMRIRWAELYRVCRERVLPRVRWRTEVTEVRGAHGEGPLSLTVRAADGAATDIDDVDLLIVTDGRFSALRRQLCGATETRHLGVANFRVLLDDGGRWDIDDLAQWHNGPCRLLAFRLKDGLVYLSGNVPIPVDQETPEHLTTADGLAQAYTPADGVMAEVPRALLAGACAAAARGELHWSRLQESDVVWSDPSARVLFLGDAGHAMVPTLGQGATMAIEDAAAWVGQMRASPDLDVPALVTRYRASRTPRVQFVRTFSWQASDVIVPGRFSLAAVRAKASPEYRCAFRRLYNPDLGLRAACPG
jgi:salicylate hydroxylase